MGRRRRRLGAPDPSDEMEFVLSFFGKFCVVTLFLKRHAKVNFRKYGRTVTW
jgi:hypothetical protein